MRRVLVIGLDGATFDLILPWVEQGELPHFARILAGGAWGPLKSTVPPMTFPAWTSFMTGKNPGKHGIFDFSEREPGDYRIRFVNAGWLKSRTIWSILSDAGKRVAVLSLPVTYPPEPLNGLMISGFDAPGVSRGQADARCMYPPSLHRELQEQLGGYIVSANAVALAGRPDTALRAILATMERKTACASYLYRKEPWDVFMLLLGETDGVAHHFWKYHDPRSPLHRRPPSPACAEAIYSVYRKADAFIGEMLDQACEETTIVLVSDHGTGGHGDTAVFLNRWLEQEGLLRYVATSRAGALGALRTRTADLAAQGLERVKRLGVKVIPQAWKSLLWRRAPAMVNRVESFLRFNAIDWTQTTAFADENPYYPQIWINLEGREPQGRVSAGKEYEAVRDAIIDRLRDWKDPDTGTPVVERVFKREEIYTGPYVHKAPDLLISWNLKDGYSYVPRRSTPDTGGAVQKLSAAAKASIKSGSHRELGILALYGDGIRANTVVKDAEIIDVAPTLLYLLGVPVPADMDGKVLEAAVHDAVLAHRPVAYGGAAGPAVGRAEDDYSADDTAVIEERLKNLGYLE